MTLLNPYRFAASSFDPIADVGWAHAYWAEGSEFAALSYSADAEVTSWPDEVGTIDLSSAAGKYPLYRATGGPNSKPGVQGDAVDDYLTGTYGAALTGTWTRVVIAVEKVSGNQRFADNGTTGSVAALDAQATNYLASAGTNRTGGVPVNNTARLLVMRSGVSPYLAVDNASAITLTIGNGDLAGITLLNARTLATRPGNHIISFAADYDGDAAADGGWADFLSWVTEHYGITLS